MATSNFVLTSTTPGIWTGKAGSNVVVSVRSVNANSTTLHDAAYPDGTAITNIANGNATFSISQDGKKHNLTVGITPPPVPDDWSMVEVGADGTTQDLLDVFAGQALGSIVIVPS
jgi:hypothetical protein